MRSWIIAALSLIALPWMAAPAAAQDYECAWRAFPAEVRAAFTRDTRIATDVTRVFESGIVTDEIIANSMGNCGLADTDAIAFGQFVAARALVVAHRARLAATYGWHDGQFDALMAPVLPGDRTIVVELTNGNEPQGVGAAMDRFRRSAAAQGAPPTDETYTRTAVEYMYARAMLEHLMPNTRF